ncbi:MAG: hypothetical protein IJ191_01725 [Treponema sp.]|nr:hypothetical protein [Treponema sp.]
MKSKTIKTIATVAFSFVFAAASAVDFGGIVGNVTKFSVQPETTYAVTQKNDVTGWLQVPFTADGSMYLALEGVVRYTYDWTNKDNSGMHTVSTDISLLKYAYTARFTPGTALQLSVGRFGISDFTGIIFNQVSDGAFLQFRMPRFEASAYAGYTGLLNAHTVSILDAAGTAYSYDATKVYPLAAPYAVAGVSIHAPYLFANQTVSGEFFVFCGVPGIDRTITHDVHFDATLGFSGPIVKNLFYTATTTVGKSNRENVSNLSRLTLTYYPPALSSSVSASLLYASGKNGRLGAFRAFTSNKATYSLLEPEYSGLIKAGLSGSVKPVTALLILAGIDVVFAVPESTASYDGFQYMLQAQYQLFSDVQLGLALSHFIGKTHEGDKFDMAFTARMSF